jgi:predicted small integral membrane protein
MLRMTVLMSFSASSKARCCFGIIPSRVSGAIMWPTAQEGVKKCFVYRRGAETQRKGILFSNLRASAVRNISGISSQGRKLWDCTAQSVSPDLIGTTSESRPVLRDDVAPAGA